MIFIAEAESPKKTVTKNKDSDKGYHAWFNSELRKKTGKTKISQLNNDEKETFFSYIDDNWNSEEEPGKDGES